MSDFDPTLDELVSAYLDDEATPAERARVESDPALLERVQTFRRLHDAIAAAPAPLAGDPRGRLIAHALAETPAPLAPVHSLAARRFSRVGPIAAAAALIAALIGFGTWVVGSQDDTSENEAATSAAITRDAFGQERAPAGTAGDSKSLDAATTIAGASAAPQAGPGFATTTKSLPFLGQFADETGLRQALVALSDRSTAPATTAAASASTTQPSATAAASASTTQPSATAAASASTTQPSALVTCAATDTANTAQYRAVLRGRPVTVIVTGARAEIVDDATCARTALDLTTR
jgi:hypothetical protein